MAATTPSLAGKVAIVTGASLLVDGGALSGVHFPRIDDGPPPVPRS